MLDYNLLNNKGTITSKYLDETIYNLLDQTFQIPQEGFNYQVFKVTEEYIARPDLISYDAYGTTDYTDILCKLNGISNPFELNEGMLIVIPAPGDLSSKSFIFPAPENEYETEDDTPTGPVQKTKHDKRKSNEAIIGDSRFKIDPSNGIIIY